MAQGSTCSEPPKEIFQKAFPKFSDSLGERTNFTTVANLLLAEDLITSGLLDGIKTQSNLTDNERGSELAHALLKKIKASDDPIRCLRTICDVLENEDVEDEKLNKHGAKMRSQLPAVDSIKRPFDVSMEDHNRVIIALKAMVQEDRHLAIVAYELKAKFGSLKVRVKRCLKLQSGLLDDAKSLVSDAISDDILCRPHVMEQYRNDLCKVADVEMLFQFLQAHSFLSYLNYRLLETISSLLDDEQIEQKFEDYRKEYTKLLKCASFDRIISVFKSIPGLKPAAVIGFPLMKLHLERPELYDSLYDCLESLQPPPSLSHFADIDTSCVVITFCVFPTSLLDLLNYLNDPANVKRLQTNGASIILELPDTDINETCQGLISRITAASLITKIHWSGATQKYSDRSSQLPHPVKRHVHTGTSTFSEPLTSQAAALPGIHVHTTTTVIPPTVSHYRADIAYDVLRTNTSLIKESGIGLDYLAGKLAEAKIITDSEKSEASDMWTGRTADQQIHRLLDILNATVKIDGSWFGWFIQVLRDMDTVLANKIADELVEKYKGHRLNN